MTKAGFCRNNHGVGHTLKRGLVSVLLYGACAFLSPVALAEDLEAYLNGVREEYGLPALAAAVVESGEILAAAATGTRIMGKDIPVTIDDRFHLGSNTKAMTATLAGMLVEEGKLRWDSTIGAILGNDVPEMTDSLAAATLEQLLSHSSGIPGDNEEILKLYFNLDAFDFDVPELRLRMLEQWKGQELHVPKGSPFQYSNLGYVIAGAMIEKVTGMSWEQLIYERLFSPLGMKTAGFGPQATYGFVDAPVGHQVQPDGTVTPIKWGGAADVPQSIGPAGNAHMSILDYAKWAGWNAARGTQSPALVSPETLQYIQSEHVRTPTRKDPPPGTPSTGGYGLGWGIVQFDWASRPLLTHNGSNSMNLAKIVVDTERKLAVVVTTNFPGDIADAATAKVMQHLYTAYAH